MLIVLVLVYCSGSVPEKAKVFLVVKGGGLFSHQFFVLFLIMFHSLVSIHL